MPITNDKGHTSITGNAINWAQVVILKNAIRLYLATGGKVIPTRGVGPKQMLALAAAYTGVKYPVGKRGMAQAATDLAGIMQRDPDSVTPGMEG